MTSKHLFRSFYRFKNGYVHGNKNITFSRFSSHTHDSKYKLKILSDYIRKENICCMNLMKFSRTTYKILLNFFEIILIILKIVNSKVQLKLFVILDVLNLIFAL